MALRSSPTPQYDPWGQLECIGMMNDPPPCGSEESRRALRHPRHTTPSNERWAEPGHRRHSPLEAELEVLPLTLQLATDTFHTTSGRGRPGHQVQGHRMALPTPPPPPGYLTSPRGLVGKSCQRKRGYRKREVGYTEETLSVILGLCLTAPLRGMQSWTCRLTMIAEKKIRRCWMTWRTASREKGV